MWSEFRGLNFVERETLYRFAVNSGVKLEEEEEERRIVECINRRI